jgi:DNA-directed RNA polymerase specialized sigma24 family protein
MQAQPRTQAEPDGYELFRKAIVERDEQAWIDSTARYRAMLISWAGRCTASGATAEHNDDIADYAFARAWAALTPDRFERFPTLAALLAYLRACVTSAAIDCARSDANFDRVALTIDTDVVATPEQIVVAEAERAEVWRVAGSATQTEQERVVLTESFVYDLPPRAILARHPALFADADAIYTIKRNLIDRLKRNPEMRRLYQEWSAA